VTELTTNQLTTSFVSLFFSNSALVKVNMKMLVAIMSHIAINVKGSKA